MNTSERGLEHIRSFESLQLKAYWDYNGLCWTIGYGHTRSAHINMVINKDEAEALLGYDVREAEAQVAHHVTVPLNQNQYDAVVSLVFNIGVGQQGLKSGIFILKDGTRSTFLRKLNSQDYVGAAIEIERWVYSGGKKLNGLVRRRAAERKMFEEPIAVPMTLAEITSTERPGKFTSIIDVMRKGSAVAEPELWKNRQITGTAFAAALVAGLHLARSFGYESPVSDEDITQAAIAVVTLWNVVLTIATSNRVGLDPKDPDKDAQQ